MIRNLGQVAAIYIGSSQPTNTNLIWLDNTVVPYAFRAYDGSTWSELATRDWVKMFVDGWLVSLPPSTQAGDTDYLLINSNNVNYKITVKEFVKSAVGNPLDFKGVIRTDADFPNPANCEAGDMYVIITSPAGGTVTDPYSGQVFEDTEKIVWDEVTKSWASLGKIEINVDLSTDYSATNVTINSSAGKSTTIEAASTSLAGVMLPQQVKRLTYLSNGSTVPGDPSELDPDTPAHKHNYGDILDRLISQQETGDSTFHPMSQKATTDNLDLKFDKANVVQVQGASTVMVMSQKAVTDAITTLDEWIKNELTKYLPLSGGDMTGDITLGNSVYILGDNTSGRSLRIAGVNANNQVVIGSLEAPTYILSNSSDLIHSRNNVSYKILDSYNLPDPATLSGDNTWTGTNTFNGITNINNSFVLANSKALQGRNVAGTLNYAIGQVNANNNVEVGDTRVPLMLVSNDSNLIHYRGTTSYGIWDAYNLPDPAAKSADNVFTGTNSFTAGKFNVGAFEVTSIGKLLINMTNTGGWEGSLCWMNNGVDDSRIMFGAYGNADVAEFAWIGVGDVQYNTAQYRFYGTSMRVPSVWSLDDAGGNTLIWTQSTQLAHFGRAMGTTKIRSGNVDLIHTKGTTDYKILDESNWESIIPNARWTYGFVGMQVGSGNQDLNTILNGDDNIKALLNYYQIGALTNAPTGMGYGSVFQLYTNAFTSYGSEVLKPQLAFDVNHNVAGSTRYMYFRTPNNLGYGDSSNWKRVVTADENVAVLVMDANTYPSIARIDGTTYNWLRTPSQGLLPNTQVTLASGGTSYLGTSDWGFKNAYISNIYANNHYFGTTGMHLEGNADEIGLLNEGVAKKLKVGSLLVSANYANTTLVPTNGIFSSGRIQSNDSMLVGYTRNTTGGQLGYGLYYGGVSNVGLGSEYSSGALILYKYVNPNIGSSGYNVPLAGSGTPTYLKITDGNLTLGVGAYKTYTAKEAVTMTEYTVLHQGNGLYLGVPTTYVPVRMPADKAALATGSGYLEWWNSGAGWVNHRAGKYIVNGGSSSQFLKGDGSLDSTAYLPLTGGTVSGSLTISPVGSAGFTVNNADTSGVDVIQTFRVKGANKFLIGWSNSGGGAFIQRSDNNRCMVLMSDGLYTGSSLGNTVRVATLTDLGGYLPLTGGTISAANSVPLIINNSVSGGTDCFVRFNLAGTANGAVGFLSSKGTYLYNYSGSKYLFLKGDGVYFGTTSSDVKLLTSADLLGYLPLAGGTMTGPIDSTANQILRYTHNSGTHSAISVTKDNPGYISVGNYSSGMRVFLLTNDSDVLHYVSTNKVDGVNYRMWDARNLDKPLRYASGGTAGNYTSVYDRNLGVNGNNWTFLSATNAATTSIYAPTSAGTSGQILKSSGTGAPVWANVSTIMEGYVKSTSTKKVTDIQVVDALPATQASGVLYLVVK